MNVMVSREAAQRKNSETAHGFLLRPRKQLLRKSGADLTKAPSTHTWRSAPNSRLVSKASSTPHGDIPTYVCPLTLLSDHDLTAAQT